MDYNNLENFGEDKISDDSITEIDPRDTYSDRFEVTSRDSSSRKPRPAIVSGSSKIRNSKRIFTSRHDRSAYGGRVNMKNVSARNNFDKVASATPKDNFKDEKIDLGQNDNVSDSVVGQKKSNKKTSGLDSLFSSTIEKNNTVNRKSKLEKLPDVFDDKQNDKTENSDAEITGRIKIDVQDMPKEPRYSTTSSVQNVDIVNSPTDLQNRGLKILKPSSFKNVEEIADAFKNKDAVVLSLKFANAENARRILDFSFGAASICGAQVSVEPDKTYVFTIGPGLTKKEKLSCINEGIIIKDE